MLKNYIKSPQDFRKSMEKGFKYKNNQGIHIRSYPEWIELPEKLGGGKVNIEFIGIYHLPVECPRCGVNGVHYFIVFENSPWDVISCESCNRFIVIEKEVEEKDTLK